MKLLLQDSRVALASALVILGLSLLPTAATAQPEGATCVVQVNGTVCYFGGKDCDTLICCDGGNPERACDA